MADLLGLTLAFALAEILYGVGVNPSLSKADQATETLLFVLTLPVWFLGARLCGLYSRDESRAHHTTVDDLAGVALLVTMGSWLLLAAGTITHLLAPAYTKVLTFWLLAVPLLTLARAGARAAYRRRLAYLQNTVVVGAGDVGQLVARKIQLHPEYGLNLVGFVDDQPKAPREDLGDVTILGAPEQLLGLLDRLDVERVIVAYTNQPFDQLVDLTRSLEDHDVQVDIVPRLFDLIGSGAEIHALESIPLIGLPPLRLSAGARAAKRAMDIVVASLGLVLGAPVFALIALLIKLDSRGPAYFRQPRVGSEGQFQMYKFRTMVLDAEDRKPDFAHLNKHQRPGGDPRMFKIPDDPRTTRVGRFLRRYSLDELPQLLNVLKGEMSLVGPRPLIPEEHLHVGEWASKRLDLRPGITGVWQVLGRSEIPFEEMIKLDYLYVTNWSLWNDFRLLLQTIPVLVNARSGSY